MSKKITSSLLRLQLLLFLAKYAFILRHKSLKSFSKLNLALDNFLEYSKNHSLKFSESLSPIPTTIEDSTVEVHTLLCKRDLHMYLWAIRSLIYHADIKFPMVVHDDGSLNETDYQLLQAKIPEIKIISRSVADQKISELLQDFPSCQAYRKRSVLSLGLFDYNLLSNADFILSFDSDILFFRPPKELIDATREKNDSVIYHTCEPSDRSYASDLVLTSQFHSIVSGFNGGLLFYPRKIFELPEVEEIVSWLLGNKENIRFRLGEQIVNAILAGRRTTFPLSDQYSNLPTANVVKDNLVSKHYHSAVKGLFWLEGIREMIQRSSEILL